MTIEEKRKALINHCQYFTSGCNKECPLSDWESCEFESFSEDVVNKAYDLMFSGSGLQKAMEKIQECGIKDSGSRREFDTGAVGDIQEGKGRCDLLPLDVVTDLIPLNANHHRVMVYISHFVNTSETFDLVSALEWFRNVRRWDLPTMLLEVAIHFEEGAKKYGEYNWQKGIPTHCYIDSAVRHYLKWLRGDKDEPHDRAFVWNILCCIWTCIHKPELNDYAKKGNEDGKH